MSLGRAIRRIRDQKGWTQGQLAMYSGVAQSYVSRIERGQHENVAAKIVAQIARALRVSTDFLFEEAGWLPPQEDMGELSRQEQDLIETLRATSNPAERREMLDHFIGLAKFSADVDGIGREYRLGKATEEHEEYEAKEE